MKDNSDAQYSTFRKNLPYLVSLLLLHPLLRRLFDHFYSGAHASPARNDFVVQGHQYDQHLATPKPPADADARLQMRMSFDVPFCILFLFALHGFSALKIGVILYTNFLLAKRLPPSRVPIATWIFNILILFANEICKGYSFVRIAEILLPWSAATPNEGQGPGVIGDWARWLDGHRGLVPRWEISFNIVILKLISFNMDYYWSLASKEVNSLEVRLKCIPFPCDITRLTIVRIRRSNWILQT